MDVGAQLAGGAATGAPAAHGAADAAFSVKADVSLTEAARLCCTGGSVFAREDAPRRANVPGQLLVVAVAVLFLAVAGDAHGSATKASLGTVRDTWYHDCRMSGVSATTTNLGLGVTGLVLVATSALGGYFAAGLFPGSERAAARRAMLRGSVGAKFALALSVPPLVLSLALYLAALPQWSRGTRLCRQCYRIYADWAAQAPRTNSNANVCPVPEHLTAVPAGVHSVAGVAGAVSLCLIAKLAALVAEKEHKAATMRLSTIKLARKSVPMADVPFAAAA